MVPNAAKSQYTEMNDTLEHVECLGNPNTSRKARPNAQKSQADRHIRQRMLKDNITRNYKFFTTFKTSQGLSAVKMHFG